MIESIMFFGGGFLVASLLALVLISFVHHRAVRLTHRRVAAAIPVSMTEIQADKDSLRAQFALSAHRLEMTVEQLKGKSAAQLAEIAQKAEAINRLKSELAEKTAITDELDTRSRTLGERVRELEQTYEANATDVEAAQRAIASRETESLQAAKDIAEHRQMVESHRAEVAVLRAKVEQLESALETARQESEDSARRLYDERIRVSAVSVDLDDRSRTVERLAPQLIHLEHEVKMRGGELDATRRQVRELESVVREQDDMLRQAETAARELQRLMDHTRDQHVRERDRLHVEKTNLEEMFTAATRAIGGHTSRINDLEAHMGEQERLIGQHEADALALDAEKQALEQLLAATKTTIERQAGRVGELEAHVEERERIIDEHEANALALRSEVAATREEQAATAERIQAERDALRRLLQHADQTLQSRAARIDDLERTLAEREALAGRRGSELEAAAQQIETLKTEAVIAGESVRSELTSLQNRLATAETGRSRAEEELAALKAETEASRKSEQAENAVVRERITEIAVRVAEMAMKIEQAEAAERAAKAELAAQMAHAAAKVGQEAAAVRIAAARTEAETAAPSREATVGHPPFSDGAAEHPEAPVDARPRLIVSMAAPAELPEAAAETPFAVDGAAAASAKPLEAVAETLLGRIESPSAPTELPEAVAEIPPATGGTAAAAPAEPLEVAAETLPARNGAATPSADTPEAEPAERIAVAETDVPHASPVS